MTQGNALKEKLKAGGIALGGWCEVASPTVANIMANTGLDFLIIDQEHGACTYETAETMCRAAEAENCTAIVRVTENREPVVLRALELGSRAILIPHVESVAEAQQAVRSSFYHPKGNRGLGPYTRNHNYTHDGLEKSVLTVNESTFVGILIEGNEGVRNIEAIAAVPGLDLIYLGVYDISQAVGLPGQLRHPTVLDALKKSAERLRSRGIAAGSYAPDLEYARLLIEQGYQFIAYSVDAFAIHKHFSEARTTLLPYIRER